MPGPIKEATVTPTVTPSAETVNGEPPKVELAVVASPVATEIPGSIAASEGTQISENVAGSVVMPHVAYVLPPVQGQKATDRGDEADFVVLHTRFGRFVQGSRLSWADLSPDADPDALIALGAIGPLRGDE